MNEEMPEELQEDEIKEILLYQIEVWDLFVIVDNCFWAYVNKSKWERVQIERAKAAELLRGSKQLLEQLFNSENASSIFNMTEEQYKANEIKYKNSIKVIKLLENDKEVQDALCKRINELYYDDSSEVSKAIN